ncbi:Pyranose dehydrogenase 1-like protein 1, partial [Phlyctema vagabunda]
FISERYAPIQRITCSREVILATGAIETPKLLELSGIGPADLVNQFDIPLVLDLPGVGNNLQALPSVEVPYFSRAFKCSSSNTFDSGMTPSNWTRQQALINETEHHSLCAINAVAFVSLESLSVNGTDILDARDPDTSTSLPFNLDTSVISGYLAQKDLLLEMLNNKTFGDTEVLSDKFGSIKLSAIHTLSRGYVHIDSLDPFAMPDIDPRFCSDSLDCHLLLEAINFTHQLLNTTAMALLQPWPLNPISGIATLDAILESILLEFDIGAYVTGTTAMLPRELGGVVDTHLRVWGTKNLRVVGAGIFPLTPAAHLEAATYAVAEKAADLIRLDNYAITPEGCGLNSTFAKTGPVLSFTNYDPPDDSSLSFDSVSEIPDGLSVSVDAMSSELRRRELASPGQVDRRYMSINITSILESSMATSVSSPNSTDLVSTTLPEITSTSLPLLPIPGTSSNSTFTSVAPNNATITNPSSSEMIMSNTTAVITADPIGTNSTQITMASRATKFSDPIGSTGLTSVVYGTISKSNYTFTTGRFSSTTDELTTTIIQDITIFRTTTVPRSRRPGTTTWLIPPPPRITLSTISRSSISAAQDAAISQAASWLDRVIEPTTIAVTENGATPTWISPQAIIVTSMDPASILDVPTSSPLQQSHESSGAPVFNNPGYYGYYGFSRTSIAQPTTVAISISTVTSTSYVTATAFVTVSVSCRA